jgi:hypothetical protein
VADYTRESITFRYSDSSDYSSPIIEETFVKERTTPTEVMRRRLSVASSGDSTITISDFTTIHSVFVTNTDATNYCTLTFASTDIASCKQRVLAGETLKLTDVLGTTVLTLRANTAATIIDVIITGL